jgi:hypothetical protein
MRDRTDKINAHPPARLPGLTDLALALADGEWPDPADPLCALLAAWLDEVDDTTGGAR